MTSTPTSRFRGTGVMLFLLLLSDPADAAPIPEETAKANALIAQLRTDADAAERAGDWELAFATHCRLFVADRSAPDGRDRLNNALRRVQQSRRHRDPAFQQFAKNLTVADALNLYAETVAKVSVVFADRDRATAQNLWEHGIVECERALASSAFRQTYLDSRTDKIDAFRVKLHDDWAKRQVASPRDARTLLRQLITAAQAAFPMRIPSALVIEFICGGCAGLDEYTVFLNPNTQTADSLTQTLCLSGYGIYLAARDGGVVVDGVSVGSWAAFHSSLRKGDRLARVNGRAIDSLASLAAGLSAPSIEGAHEIELVPTDDGTPRDIARLPLVIPSVYGQSMLAQDGVGYARLGSFQASTPRELDDAISSLKARGMRVMVLDLRGNHGGVFTAGLETARRLLPSGIIVTTQGQVGESANRVFSSDSGMLATDIPLVVLIDVETASTAEMFAAVLKDNNRAVLVGMPSFGKGAIQYPLKLSSIDDSTDAGRTRGKSGLVRVTFARLISPQGQPINGIGITPHIQEADPTRQLQLAVERAIELMPRSPMMMSP